MRNADKDIWAQMLIRVLFFIAKAAYMPSIIEMVDDLQITQTMENQEVT